MATSVSSADTFVKQSRYLPTESYVLTTVDNTFSAMFKFTMQPGCAFAVDPTKRMWTLTDDENNVSLQLLLTDESREISTPYEMTDLLREWNPTLDQEDIDDLDFFLLASLACLFQAGADFDNHYILDSWRTRYELCALAPPQRADVLRSFASPMAAASAEPVPPTVVNAEDTTCAVCQENRSDPVGQPKICQHLFCYDCITRAAETDTRCPICFRSFTAIYKYQKGERIGKTNVVACARTHSYTPEEEHALAAAYAEGGSGHGPGHGSRDDDAEGIAAYHAMYGNADESGGSGSESAASSSDHVMGLPDLTPGSAAYAPESPEYIPYSPVSPHEAQP